MRAEGSGSTRPASRRWIARVGLIALVSVFSAGMALGEQGQAEGRRAREFELLEATIPELQAALESGEVTSRELVEMYLARIAAFDDDGPALNAMISINEHALAEADARDAERRGRRPRGPLHGIPVIVKDNYDTADMPTTAGSLTLDGVVPPDDAFQIRKLREAGAIILGKSNLHEFAFGWETVSSLDGQTRNPYDPSRMPGGSSGGTGAAVAANFAAAGFGSDTCGSIRVPAALNNLVGIRPTKGLSSIDGIIPLAKTQDVGGPLARTVVDAVILLDATVGFDPADPITALGAGEIPATYTAYLDARALRGARIGVLTDFFGTAPEDAEVNAIVRAAVEDMRRRGVEVVEVSIPDLTEMLAGSSVIIQEFQAHIEEYLAATPGAPQTLQEIVDSGLVHPAVQPLLELSLEQASVGTEPYKDRLLMRDTLLIATLAVMAEHDLDALVYPTVNRPAAPIGEDQEGTTPNCRLSPHTGMPAITVPAGFTADGLPVGVEFLGRPFDEPTIIALGFAYEQATGHRTPPASTPALPDEDEEEKGRPWRDD